MGWLYDRDLTTVIVAAACATEAVAVFLFIRMNRMARTT